MKLIKKLLKLIFTPPEEQKPLEITYKCTRHFGETCPSYKKHCKGCIHAR